MAQVGVVKTRIEFFERRYGVRLDEDYSSSKNLKLVGKDHQCCDILTSTLEVLNSSVDFHLSDRIQEIKEVLRAPPKSAFPDSTLKRLKQARKSERPPSVIIEFETECERENWLNQLTGAFKKVDVPSGGPLKLRKVPSLQNINTQGYDWKSLCKKTNDFARRHGYDIVSMKRGVILLEKSDSVICVKSENDLIL